MEELEIKRLAFSGVFWKFAERFIAQGISLIISIIIARILSPTAYSVVGIVTIFFNFANVFITSGLNTALVQKKQADELDYSTILYTSFLLSCILYAVLFLLAPIIANLYNQTVLIKMIRVMGLSLIVISIKSIWCAYISSNLLFKKFFISTLFGTIVSGIVGIYMALNGFGAWALIAQQITNTVVDTILLILTTRVTIVPKFSFFRLKQLFKYGWKVFASALIGTIYTEISPMIIGLKFSVSDLSFYTKGRSFPSMLATTSTSTLSAVLFPVLAKYQDEKDRILSYTRLFIRLSSYLCFPFLLGLFSVSNNFVFVILTEKWMQAAYYIRVFSIAFMFDVVAIGNCETIKAIGRSDVYLVIEIIKKTCYFLIIFVFVVFAKSSKVLALAFIACAIVQVIVNSIPNIKLIGYKLKYQLSDLLPNLVNSVIMCCCSTAIGLVFEPGLLALLVQFLTGVMVYVLLGVLTRNSALFYLLNVLKGYFRRKNDKQGI